MNLLDLAGLLAFVVVGISLGLLGGGGSILAVPVLVYLMGIPAGIAVPMSLPVVGVAAAVGAQRRWKAGQLDVGAALTFAVIAMTAAFAAARLGAGIPDDLRLTIFVAVMLMAAALMWHRSRLSAPVPVAPSEERGRSLALPTLIPAAALVGTLTGLVGVGGGFMIVPVLVGALAMPMPRATATSLAVIALNTAAAGAGWWGKVSLDIPLTVTITAMALIGMLIGTRLAPRFSARTLTRGFAMLLIGVSAMMLAMTLGRS